MKQPGAARKRYNGNKRALVIALDVGTTFSGVSYALLDPGEIPKIYEVTRFVGQEDQAGNYKTPSVIWYDRHGDAVKAGAEAEDPSVVNTAEEQGWTKVELFKLRLRPKSMKLEMNGMKLSHLPKSKSAVEVFGDFLKYLFRCTRSFIIDSHATGASVWKSVENDIQFVLSHPNGWEGAQQSKMRKAAVYAGLVPNTDEGKARIRFVTEGEASLHACVLNGLTDDVLSTPSQHGFIVADAGGGTLDISSYAVKGVSPLLIEEIAPPDCLFSGSIFVSRRARKFLEYKLKGSPQYSTPAVLDHIAKRFDESTKRLFRSRTEVQFLNFGSPLDKDHSVGIRGGRLRLTGDEVAELFEPSIEAAVSSIRNQVDLSGGMIKSVWLVGGFASSPWLFAQLQERLTPDGIVVSRPDGQTSKAVADGAIAFYCDHHVGARIAKYMYGVEFLREFDSTDPEHRERQSRLFQLPSGPELLPDAFDCILARNSRVKESTTFSRKYCTELTSLSTLSVFEIEIWCYRGPGEQPKWILRGQDDFSTLCFVRADLSPLTGSAKTMTGQSGKKYWTIVFSIEIHFGLTEFKARIKWNDDGKVRYGPASIVYDEGGNKELEDDRDSQDEISVLPSSRYASRAPSMAPSRTHSMSNTPQTFHSPVDDHSAVGIQISRSHSTSQSNGDRHPDGYTESSVSKKSKSSGSHSHPKPPPQRLSPDPPNASHHISRSEWSQNSPRSSQHHSHHSASPREPPRDTSYHTPSPREPPHHPVSHPASREPSQLSYQGSVTTPTSTVHTQHNDREIPGNGYPTPDYYASTPTQSHISQSKQPAPSLSVLGDPASSISRAHPRSKNIVATTQPADQTAIKFPSVSTTGSPYETPALRSVAGSRKTSLTPSDSASNVPVNYMYGSGTVPGTVAGSLVGSALPESTVSKKSKKDKKDKNRSVLSTITSETHSTTKSPMEQPPPPEPAPSVPQISIPGSPSVSSSLGGSRLTTKPNTPIVTRSIKSSLASSLSYVTDRPEQPSPHQPSVMSRQNSDTGGLGSTLGGVLTDIWSSYKSASASPVVENPPPGPATAAFESTLETIQDDIEVPGGFGGEREREAPVPPQESIPEPVIIPPSPQTLEEPEPLGVPAPEVEIADPPAPKPVPLEHGPETVPQTPIEPESSVLSTADRKKTKKQREKERREKKESEERERVEREAREARERKDHEEREEKKRQEQADRDARKKKEREEREERERVEREEHEAQERERQERANREARKKDREERKRQEQERIEREAHEQVEREAREKAEREAREQAEREAKERAEREAREARKQAEREQAEKAAREKMDKVTRRRAEREAAKKAEQEAQEKTKREAKEKAEEAARVRAERDARQRAEKEAKEKAEQEARESAEREAKAKAEREKERLEREERERIEKEKERIERERERVEKEEKERAEREAKEKAEREAKEREEEEKKKVPASKIPSAWGSTVGKSDRSRKSTALSQKERKNEWANGWDSGPTEEEPSGLLPIITSSASGGIFNGAGNFDFFATGEKDPPGVAEEVELRTPLTKRGEKGVDSPSNRSKVATPTESADAGGLDMLKDLNMNNMSARVSISSENERFTDAEQGPSPTEPTHPETASEALLSTTSELLKTPEVKEEIPTTPKPWPAPSLTSTHQPQVPTPAPVSAKTEPEKPLSLWDRKKLKTTPPAPASSLFGGGEAVNSPGVWEDASGGGRNTESIAMPTLVGDRQSIFTDTAHDQKRENQREGVVEGVLGSGSARRRNDSAQSGMTAKPAPKPAPAPAPAQQKSGGWGSWGSSLLNNIANVVTTERTPSPEPPTVRPKIEDPPRGSTPNQPPKSQPAGFGSLNKPAWGPGPGPGPGTGDNNAWGAGKPGPTPIAQKTSAGPAWGAKPAGSTFGSGGTAWGSGTGSTFSSGMGKNLTVDTATKPLESSPNTAGPENIPESAVEIKRVPAPGAFNSSITDGKEEAGDAQADGWGEWEETKTKGSKQNSKLPSPARETALEPQVEETEQPAKTEEAATPAEEDEFDWANQGKKKKGSRVASVAHTPSAPNTPDPDNADDGPATGGGGGGNKKKKKKGKR